jgi:hypothetical protein
MPCGGRACSPMCSRISVYTSKGTLVVFYLENGTLPNAAVVGTVVTVTVSGGRTT